MPITPTEALQRTIEHREIFHDEMLHLMRLIMQGEMTPVMTAAIITGLRVKKETIGEITAAAQVMREGKVQRLQQWLLDQGLDFDRVDATFYSDSVNDLPLLGRVQHPVATNPDARLREHAQLKGWPILELFERE